MAVDTASSIATGRKAAPNSDRFSMSQETRRGLTLLSPTLILLVLTLALPVLVLIGLSFWTQVGMTLTPGFTLENYDAFFENLSAGSAALDRELGNGRVFDGDPSLSCSVFHCLQGQKAEDALAYPDNPAFLDKLSASRFRMEDHSRLQRGYQFRSNLNRPD
ncbi:MAG: hypothetical protein ACMZ66_20870 [Thalassospira sp.]|uniref:hypothetical protein n=1 Tax=Thalassospira sp. TaxID=1912094 RepID=UPI003A89D22F